MSVANIDEAIRFINAHPKPLALYLFSPNTKTQHEVVTRTSSGGVSINHAWLHLSVHALPFGGVGESGMGAYHGKATFDLFTHHKSVLTKPTILDTSVIYPPYTAGKQALIRRIL
jgi:aldehyde dehydrogenase (NAD+)